MLTKQQKEKVSKQIKENVENSCNRCGSKKIIKVCSNCKAVKE